MFKKAIIHLLIIILIIAGSVICTAVLLKSNYKRATIEYEYSVDELTKSIRRKDIIISGLGISISEYERIIESRDIELSRFRESISSLTFRATNELQTIRELEAIYTELTERDRENQE